MKILVVGASGATGRLLVTQLLAGGNSVIAVVRPDSVISEETTRHEKLTLVRLNLLDLDDEARSQMVDGCDAIASCLGHNLNLKGIYGQPRKLVTDSVQSLCRAARNKDPNPTIKVVLMTSAGVGNRGIGEQVSFSEACFISLLRVLVPPHADNEQAAEFLRTAVGPSDKSIEWVVVRPDTLIDENLITDYQLHGSPTRSAIFNPGTTSRINVAHFMAKLITNDEAWANWKGKMPVVYNAVE